MIKIVRCSAISILQHRKILWWGVWARVCVCVCICEWMSECVFVVGGRSSACDLLASDIDYIFWIYVHLFFFLFCFFFTVYRLILWIKAIKAYAHTKSNTNSSICCAINFILYIHEMDYILSIRQRFNNRKKIVIFTDWEKHWASATLLYLQAL